MRLLIVTSIFSYLIIASTIYAQENAAQDQEKVTYGKRGIIELNGALSVSGNSEDSNSIRFNAGPGFNYFVADNVYIGADLYVGIRRGLVSKYYLYFYSRRYPKTFVDLGLSIPVGFLFRLKDQIYFNLAPEMQFIVADLKHFRAYQNFITSIKFTVSNAVINVGVKHNFFYLTEKKISDVYYSFNLFLGLSVFFNTAVK
jgi:hypothetical protein